MAKRCIGLDITAEHIRAVQAVRFGSGITVEKTLSVKMRRSTDSPSEILRSLLHQHRFDRRAEIAVSLPHNAVFFKTIKADPALRLKIRNQDFSQLQNYFPVSKDQLLAIECKTERTAGQGADQPTVQISEQTEPMLISATSRDTLQHYIKLLAQARLTPVAADTHVQAIYNAIVVNYPQIRSELACIIYLDTDFVTVIVIRQNNITLVRNVPVSYKTIDDDTTIEPAVEQIVQQTKIALNKAFADDDSPEIRIYLVADEDVSETISSRLQQDIACKVTVADLWQKTNIRQKPEQSHLYCIAQGLTAKTLLNKHKPGNDFIATASTALKQPVNLRKELTFCSTLIAAIIVFWLIGLFTKLSRLESNYTGLKKQTIKIFRQTFPTERNIVIPVAQMQQQLDSVLKQYKLYKNFNPRYSSLLDTLKQISITMPAQTKIEIKDLQINEDSVRIIGSAETSQPIFDWLKKLTDVTAFEPAAEPVTSRDPDSGKINFTIVMQAKNL